MEVSKLVSLEVIKEQLSALETLLFEKLGADEIRKVKDKVAPLLQSLINAYESNELSNEVKALVEENRRLRLQAGGLKYQVQLAKDLSKYAKANMAAVAADLVLNPDPVEIPCTERGRRLNFMVSLNNVLAIVSAGRVKWIYLKEPIIPKEGGKSYNRIGTNSSELDFEKLLYKLQVRRKHLFRVSKSKALNIFHYTLSESNTFHIIEKPQGDIYDSILAVTIDKYFKLEDYHKQLFELDYMYKYRSHFALNDQKIDEITRYMDSLDVTNQL